MNQITKKRTTFLSGFALCLSVVLSMQACGTPAQNQKEECGNPIELGRSDALQISFGDVFGGAPSGNNIEYVYQDGMVWTEDFFVQTNKIHAVALPVYGVALNALSAGATNNIQSPLNVPALCQRMDGQGDLLASLNLPGRIGEDGTVIEGHMWQANLSRPTAEAVTALSVYPSTLLQGTSMATDLESYFLDNAEDVFRPTLEEGGEHGQVKVYSLSEFEFEVRGYRKKYLGEPGKSALRTIYYRARYARSL